VTSSLKLKKADLVQECYHNHIWLMEAITRSDAAKEFEKESQDIKRILKENLLSETNELLAHIEALIGL